MSVLDGVLRRWTNVVARDGDGEARNEDGDVLEHDDDENWGRVRSWKKEETSQGVGTGSRVTRRHSIMESTAQNGVFMPKKKGRSVKIEEGGPLEDNVEKRADARREAGYRRGDKEALKILGR
ncbi:hypothetical protein GCK72_018718 [Caenorhabditis remanei]|uniref:Uncharacterized protein n=1 Tax=Caenorhabditis remanei TaxID=31234 RepID=A0A6A5GBQ3_CAERE|nr:hypothetical protein GCK72_018718 [Caenorhabditis remanei]KAF1752164.1 hypothetical protein GCK72_018718 [Caenorhabditis remanei]